MLIIINWSSPSCNILRENLAVTADLYIALLSLVTMACHKLMLMMTLSWWCRVSISHVQRCKKIQKAIILGHDLSPSPHDVVQTAIAASYEPTGLEPRHLHKQQTQYVIIPHWSLRTLSLSGFSGPPYISATCDIGALGSLSLVSSEPAHTCSLRGTVLSVPVRQWC